MTGALSIVLLLLAPQAASAGRFPIGLCEAGDPRYSAALSESGFDPVQDSSACVAAKDAQLVDWRPVPGQRPDALADALEAARDRGPKGKPVWAVLRVSDKRVMDFVEIRYLSYLAVMHGAQGIFYSSFTRPDGTNLLDHPEEWQALSRVARELKSLQGVLADGQAIPVPFPPNPDALEAKAWRYHDRDYVLVLNRYGKYGQERAPLPEELLGPAWRPLFEIQRDPCETFPKEETSCVLPPYRALVFEGRRRWSWKNPLGLFQ